MANSSLRGGMGIEPGGPFTGESPCQILIMSRCSLRASASRCVALSTDGPRNQLPDSRQNVHELLLVDYVKVYSGPEPPSGGVSRPPFAVIAPHWTQLDGVTSTSTSPFPTSRPSA